MLRNLLLGLLLWAGAVSASQPLYFYPSLIRGYQLLWQHEAQGSPNAEIHFVGPFGLHPVAAARFGWEREACLDSAKAFHLAETLWLDYYCAMGDSAQADLALVYGPAHVKRWTDDQLATTKQKLEADKTNPSASPRASYAVPPPPPPVEKPAPEEAPNLAAIPKFTTYKVQPGDSLWKIHQKFPQHSLAKLIEANGGKEAIYIGQILQIPL